MHVQYKYLIVFPINEGKFELVLSGVNGEHPGLALSVQTVHLAPLDCRDVDRQVQGTNDTMVTGGGGGGILMNDNYLSSKGKGSTIGC